MPRLAAALVALAAWAGLAIQFDATFANQNDVAATLWILLRFFTVITNLMFAATMTAIAFGRRVSAFWLGGITLAMLLVGIIYTLLLRGLLELSGGARLADFLLHKLSPGAAAFYWLLFAPRERLRWRDPLLWSIYPAAYLAYALARGAAGDRYPYPFIDIREIGAIQAAANSALIALGFLFAGLCLVALDRALGRRRSSP